MALWESIRKEKLVVGVTLLGILLSVLAYVWRAQFVHAGNVLLLVIAPYYLFAGVDESPNILAFLAAQLAFYLGIAFLLRTIGNRLLGP